jgi:TonB family protein
VKKTLSTILQGGDIDEHLKSAWIAYADSGDNKNIIERTHPKGIIGVLEGDRVVYSAPNLMAPKAIYTRDPEYPEDAMSKRIEGTVVLGIIINEKGYPEILQVLRPLKDDLDVSALAAVATWRFHPATKDGVPVATKVSVEVSFRAR